MRTAIVAALLPAVVASAPVASAQAGPSVDALALDAVHGIPPQPPRVADLFRRARPLEAASFDGMLLCELRVEGNAFDGDDPLGPVRRYMGRAELQVETALPGREDVVRYLGPDDTNRVTFALAGAHLDDGDTVRMVVADRDVVTSDTIGALQLSYGGRLPLRAEAGVARVECRGMTSAALASRIEDAIDDVDDAIADLDRQGEPSEALVGFRPASANPGAALAKTFALAAWTGLEDARFLERRDRLRAREARFIEQVQALIARLRAAAPSIGTELPLPGGRASLVVEEFDCKLDEILELHATFGLEVPIECALHVRFRADRELRPSLAFHVVDDLGAAFAVEAFGLRIDDGYAERPLRLPAGESHWVLPVATHRGELLRVASGSDVVFARIDLPPTAPDTAPADPGTPGRIDLRSRRTAPPRREP